MSEMRFQLYERPGVELGPFVSGHPPRWVLRLYESRGGTADNFSPSAVVEALSESIGRRLEGIAFVMRKAENRGWMVEIVGDAVTIESLVSATRTRELMEEDGVWDLACRYLAAEPNMLAR